ncbi:hypothetical protein Cyrtocomes_01185 [Candidatus Cyrtobacter comes]|uniref:Uncharacterized protein n=1 Tax=Candidatus Cyrtobacter comes TaxID=675776 RepID=A0ABU5LA59_9RICK|nr:hypothetical protein [Candidatus Cyrtobacter comes]
MPSIQGAIELEPKLAFQLAIDFFKNPEEVLLSELRNLIKDKQIAYEANLDLQTAIKKNEVSLLIRALEILSMTDKERKDMVAMEDMF